MKKLLLFALFALCACHAEARTIYVDAKRPNNNGNGFSKAKAKKTIQAAINVARKGDTILVYPGTYAPIKTKNKKIKIKSAKGNAKTSIQPKNSGRSNVHALDLGKGTRSSVKGFRVFQTSRNVDGAIFGGRASNCRFEVMGGKYAGGESRHTFSNTKLTACVLNRCGPGTGGTAFVWKSTLIRCAISEAETWYGGNHCEADLEKSILVNCLLTGNGTGVGSRDHVRLKGCTVVNCTFVANPDMKVQSTKSYNSVFVPVSWAPIRYGSRNSFKNCSRGTDPCFVSAPTVERETETIVYDWDETGEYAYEDVRHVFAPGDCRLRQGSPCIDRGRLTKAQKKLVGTKDLAGRKRIRGKAIDRGCYEY